MVSMSTLTQVDRKILYALAVAEKWQMNSLFQLSVDLGIDYSHAWASIAFLERIGLVDVQRGAGRGMVISLSPLCTPDTSQNSYPQRGTVNNPAGYGIRNTQGEDMSEDVNIDDLRASLNNQSPTDYPRPEMTSADQEKYSRVARRINSIQDQRMRLVYLAAMIGENVRLLREVNEHRQARGYRPLPEYDPEHRA